jgi:hypothetical protein
MADLVVVDPFEHAALVPLPVSAEPKGSTQECIWPSQPGSGVRLRAASFA